LFLPFQPHKQGKSINAIKKGLLPLADLLWQQEPLSKPLEALAADYLNTDQEITTPEQALEGARSILTERIAETAYIRKELRKLIHKIGTLKSKATQKAQEIKNNFREYYDFSAPVFSVGNQHYLTIMRGERKKFLMTSIDIDDDEILSWLNKDIITTEEPILRFQLEAIISEVYHQILKPIILADIKQRLREIAQDNAINIFATNLYNQLLYPPLGNKRLIAIHTIKKGEICLVVLNEAGAILEHRTLSITKDKREAALEIFKTYTNKYQPEVIVIGKDGLSKDVDDLVKQFLATNNLNIPHLELLAPEAKFYAKSEQAGMELAKQDEHTRMTIYIGRKLRDPLAELVKINQTDLSVGPYQNEVEPNQLTSKLNRMINIAVNRVGVDINTASTSLLQYVSGLNKELADKIIQTRKENGLFKSIEDLKGIDGITEEIFTQTKGFVYISDPKSPHRDSRKKLELIHFDPKITKISDLKPDHKQKGYVTNLTSYGIFVDIGLGHDAMIHKSQLPKSLADKFMRVLKLGQNVTVKVLSVDPSKKRVQLALIDDYKPRQNSAPRRATRYAHADKPRGKGKFKGSKSKKFDTKKKKPFERKSQFGTLADKFSNLNPSKS